MRSGATEKRKYTYSSDQLRLGYLVLWNREREGLVEGRGQRLMFHRSLAFLPFIALVNQPELHVRV